MSEVVVVTEQVLEVVEVSSSDTTVVISNLRGPQGAQGDQQIVDAAEAAQAAAEAAQAAAEAAETAAAGSATFAAGSASTATTQATNSAISATAAHTAKVASEAAQASAEAASTTATTQAGIATTKAGEAAASAASITSRTINTTSPLAGGGALTGDLTLTVGAGSTSAAGVVQLEDSTTSTSTTKAATPASVKSAYDLATTAKSTADAAIPATQKGAANGVATLGSDGLVPANQLPALAITDTFVVASQSAMLALTAQTGDVAVRTDLSKSFILTATPASTLGNWQELLTPPDAVSSVNGKTGVVSLTYSDVGADAAGAAAAVTTTSIGAVPTTRSVLTTSPLSGGGALSGDLTLSVGAGSTSAAGILQLTDSTSSTSTTTAATPNSVKSAYDLANGKPSLSTSNPSALGAAAPGSGTAASKDDHVHPTTGLALLGSANTFTAAQTAYAFIPSNSTVPTNGLFLPAANMLGLATNSVERLRITSGGYVSIGNGLTASVPLHVNTQSQGGIWIDQYSNDTTAAIYVGRKSRGSLASPTATQANDPLAGVGGRGYGATGWSANVGLVAAYAAENFTDSAQGAYIVFGTTPTGSTTRAERMRIDAAGQVGIGTTGPVDRLHVAGGGTTIELSSATSGSASFLSRKSRGTSSSPTATQKDDALLGLSGRGYGATAWGSTSVANFSFFAAENFTDSAQGTYLTISTTPTGSTTRAERLRVTSGGLILINTTTETLGSGTVASQLGVVAGEATTVGAVIRGAASQTANLTEWQNSSGTVLASMGSGGIVTAGVASTALAGISADRALLISATSASTSSILGAAESQQASGGSAGAFFALYSNDGAAMASGDRLGGFLIGGSSSSTAVRNATLIASFAQNNWVDGSDYGAYISLNVTPSGSTTRAERWRLTGEGVVLMVNASAVPGSNPSGGGYLYSEGGALKWRGSSGTITTIANA